MTNLELLQELSAAGVHSSRDAIAVLCDGEALAKLGIGDNHQQVVESLHADLLAGLVCVVVCLNDGIGRAQYFPDFGSAERYQLHKNTESARFDGGHYVWQLYELDGYLEHLEVQASDSPHHGYACKECGQSSPLGVGFVADGIAAWLASQNLSQCVCGHSVRAGGAL